MTENKKQMVDVAQELAKTHPIAAIILTLALALGLPSGFGFFGAQSGAQLMSEKIQNHEIRIVTVERDISEIKEANKDNQMLMREVREHMIRQNEQIATMQKAIDEIKVDTLNRNK